MKRLIAAGGILLLLLGITLLNGWYLDGLTRQATQTLTQAQALAQQDRWAEATCTTEDLYTDWQTHAFYFHATMCHSDIDQIQRSFQTVLQYLTLKELSPYTAANVDLVMQIELLGEMERPSLDNVL